MLSLVFALNDFLARLELDIFEISTTVHPIDESQVFEKITKNFLRRNGKGVLVSLKK